MHALNGKIEGCAPWLVLHAFKVAIHKTPVLVALFLADVRTAFNLVVLPYIDHTKEFPKPVVAVGDTLRHIRCPVTGGQRI